jgi:hypothetical protein
VTSFNDFFGGLREEFESYEAIGVIRGPRYHIPWPDGYGVYTLWQNNIAAEGLIYVGLTGKYRRGDDGKVNLNAGSFKKRTSRYTPYRFCESAKKDPEDLRFSFRYGPKYSNVAEQGRCKHDLDAYRHTIPYREMIVVTFDLSKYQKYSPALLESLILTEYFNDKQDLPPANNEL